jgi:hypothetical protein
LRRNPRGIPKRQGSRRQSERQHFLRSPQWVCQRGGARLSQ